MVNRPDSKKARQKRHTRVRAKISGTAECPRLNVFRSLQHIYAQIIDDVSGKTLVSASTVEKDFEDYGGNKSAARKVGITLAKSSRKGNNRCCFRPRRLRLSRPCSGTGRRRP